MEKTTKDLTERIDQIVAIRNRQLETAAKQEPEIESAACLTFKKMEQAVVETAKLMLQNLLAAKTDDFVYIENDSDNPYYFRIMVFLKGKPLQTYRRSAPGIKVWFDKKTEQVTIVRQTSYDAKEFQEQTIPLEQLSEDYFINEFIQNLSAIFDHDATEREKRLSEIKAKAGR